MWEIFLTTCLVLTVVIKFERDSFVYWHFILVDPVMIWAIIGDGKII